MTTMDTRLDEVQQMVLDAFADFFRREVPISRVRAAEGTAGFDADLWTAFQEVGGERVATQEGGGTLLDAALIGVEAGRSLAPIPYADVVAAIRLAEATDLDLSGAGLPSVVVADEGTLAGGHLSPMGAVTDAVVLLQGGRAHLVRLAEPGRPVANLGNLPMGRLPVDVGQADAVAELGSAGDRWRDDVRLLRAASLVGAGEAALVLATEHVRERHQFGRPIGSFQALQHRLATVATSLRAARLLVLRAASYGEAPARSYHGAVAAVAASDAAELAGREGLQLFGGYGYTLEYDIHLFLRTIKAWRVLVRAEALVDAEPGERWGTREGQR